jgi:hypothetical protein
MIGLEFESVSLAIGSDAELEDSVQDVKQNPKSKDEHKILFNAIVNATKFMQN